MVGRQHDLFRRDDDAAVADLYTIIQCTFWVGSYNVISCTEGCSDDDDDDDEGCAG
jgi:hypothetical protein